jgi:hypothetical protein
VVKMAVGNHRLSTAIVTTESPIESYYDLQ